MNIPTILKVLKNERECIKRQGTAKCNRDCKACELCLPDEEILSVYDFLIEGYETLISRNENVSYTLKCDTSRLSQEEYQRLVDSLKCTNFGKIEAIGKEYE